MTEASPQVAHEGGCLCGDIRYLARGEPISAPACHCRFCQRMTGTAFFVEVFFPRNAVTYSGSAPASYTHLSDESGRWIRLDFCARCGTRVGIALELRPERIGLPGGTFDDPNWFEVKRHIWTRSMVHWMVLPEDHERFATRSPNTPGPGQST
ncbi:MAG TPA: GFA family protein [Acetobacteraceae bacterium]|nr:GFA family protein [Acetobacteraceae bacterium]